MRILVTGSRGWDNRQALYDRLALAEQTLIDSDHVRYLSEGITIVHGAAPAGADRWAHRWADSNFSVEEESHPADWKGPAKKGAGFERNAYMVRLGADLCLAFLSVCGLNNCDKPHPHYSHGASHCADLAEEAGIPTIRYYAHEGD